MEDFYLTLMASGDSPSENEENTDGVTDLDDDDDDDENEDDDLDEEEDPSIVDPNKD